jgi:hypothetical protein
MVATTTSKTYTATLQRVHTDHVEAIVDFVCRVFSTTRPSVCIGIAPSKRNAKCVEVEICADNRADVDCVYGFFLGYAAGTYHHYTQE